MSCCGNLLIAVVIYRNKELQAHPMQLFMWISFVDSGMFWNFFFSKYVCSSNLADLLAMSFFLTPSDQSKSNFTFILITTKGFLQAFFLALSITLNTCVCCDMILMLRSPLHDKSARVRKYVAISVFISIICAFGNMAAYEPGMNSLFFALEFNVMITTFFFVALYSVYYGSKKLSEPGINQEVKTLVMKRHTTLIIFTFILNTDIWLETLLMMVRIYRTDEEESYSYDGFLTSTVKLIFYMQGIVMPLLRLNEPAFYQIIQRSATAALIYVGLRPETSRKDIEIKEIRPLFLFLSDSYNVELVYIILKSVTEFSNWKPMRNTCNNRKQSHYFNKSNLLDTIVEKDGDFTLTLKRIKINNSEAWS